MGKHIKVSGTPYLKVERLLKYEFPKEINAAMASALNKTAAAIRTETTKLVSDAAKVKPAKLIRNRIKIGKATAKKKYVTISFNVSPLPVEVMKEPKWNRKMIGAKVGSTTYLGTFTGTPRKGRLADKRVRVYERVSNSKDNRKALKPITVEIKKYDKFLKTAGDNKVKTMLQRTFEQQLKYRLDKITNKVGK